MNKLLKTVLIASGAAAAIKGLDARLEITYETITSSKVPQSFNGYKIAHLSDYHSDFVPDLMSELKEENPDLIVCTGDMADDKGSYKPATILTDRLSKIAPVLMVTGNHDLWRSDFHQMENEMLQVGAKFLHNERVFITKNDEKIAISGIDDPYSCLKENVDSYINKTMDNLSEYEGFEILLFHRANLLDRFTKYNFDLILAGHMHGGHIRIPGIGGLAAPRSSMVGGEKIFFPKYFGGRYHSGNTVMLVNRGLGNPMFIPRLFNRPEMIIITLKKTQN